MIATTAWLTEVLTSVPHDQVEKTEAIAKRVGGIRAALSAYLRTGKRQCADIGAYAALWDGIVQTFAHGQKTALLGYAIAAKHRSVSLETLVRLGVMSESGDVLIGVVPEGKDWAKTAKLRATQFVALCLADAQIASDTAKAERKILANEKRAAKLALPQPGDVVDVEIDLVIEAVLSAIREGDLTESELSRIKSAIVEIETLPAMPKVLELEYA